ncbi:hypothetical protein [Xenorhabdus bovienii]|uniref:hypothetical protein n=1 Tax=Xenorhabdus bovienii TaxID=40576 RepID=UPI0018AF627B|nr:hypothetical protein [Xenorhabdus bovienii]
MHFAKMNCLLTFGPAFFTLLRCFMTWKGHDEKAGFTAPDGMGGITVRRRKNGGLYR